MALVHPSGLFSYSHTVQETTLVYKDATLLCDLSIDQIPPGVLAFFLTFHCDDACKRGTHFDEIFDNDYYIAGWDSNGELILDWPLAADARVLSPQ